MSPTATIAETDASDAPLQSSGHDTSLVRRAFAWVDTNRGPSAVLALSVAITTYLTANTLAEHPPLYWDEAVYANRGRFFVGELDDGVGYWSAYRAPGLSFMMSLGFRIFGVGTLGVRLPAAVFGTLLVVLVFLLGLLVLDAWAGAAASAVLALSFGFTRFAAYGVPDVPGAALGLAAIVVALWAWRGDRLHPSAYALVPLLAGLATYVRFGAPLALGLGLICVVIFVGLGQRRGRIGLFAKEVTTLAAATLIPVVAILRIPFFTAQDISPFTAQRNFQAGRSIPVMDSVGETVSIIWPDGQRFDFFQPLVFFVAIALAGVGCVAGLLEPRYRRASVFCMLGLSLTLVGLNLALDHMETRYLIVALPYFAVLVGVGFAALRAQFAAQPKVLWGVAGATGVLAVVSLSQSLDRQIDHAQRLQASFGVIEDAGLRLASLDDSDCIVVSGRAAQVGWYSQCRTASWRVGVDQPITEQITHRTAGHDAPGTVYVVDIVGHNRQPDTHEFDGSLFTPVIEAGQEGARSGLYVRVQRVDDCVRENACP